MHALHTYTQSLKKKEGRLLWSRGKEIRAMLCSRRSNGKAIRYAERRVKYQSELTIKRDSSWVTRPKRFLVPSVPWHLFRFTASMASALSYIPGLLWEWRHPTIQCHTWAALRINPTRLDLAISHPLISERGDRQTSFKLLKKRPTYHKEIPLVQVNYRLK